MFELVRQNKRRSIILAFIMLTLMLTIGYIIGAFLAYCYYILITHPFIEYQPTYQKPSHTQQFNQYQHTQNQFSQYPNRYSNPTYSNYPSKTHPYTTQSGTYRYPTQKNKPSYPHRYHSTTYPKLTKEQIHAYTFYYWGPVGSIAAFAAWLVQMIIAYFSGGNILLSISNAQKISKNDHPQLYNVVEEMKIASRLPTMPEIYIIDDMTMNAFATGRSPQKSAVAVTRGLLTYMNRDQLQGVIAHEISHIINRDTLYMTMLAVSVGTIILLVETLRGIVGSAIRGVTYGSRYSSRRNREGFGIILLFLVVVYLFALILSIIAPLLATIIYFASSRRREYLADAYSVVLTRNPEGLASALEEISASYLAKPIKTEVNKLVAPMYIVNPLELRNLSTSTIFSTHPPIEKRIQILRAIAKNPSLASYEQAWLKITKTNRNLFTTPPKPETQEQIAPPTATPLTTPSQPTAPEPTTSTSTQKLSPTDIQKNARSAGNALLKAQNYRFFRCYCGILLKIPPHYKGKVTCPRCKSIHTFS